MSEDLKPCPFCGSRDVVLMRLSTMFRFVYCCNSCHATSGEYVFKEEAIKAWNKRPSPWHTGVPTGDGWYLVQVTYGYYFVLDINPLGKFMVDAFGERTELTKEDIECVVAYQKIEPVKA